MTGELDIGGRTILVTGASSGIGRHLAGFLAAKGARVAACARRMDRLNNLAGEVAVTGGTLVPVEMDVSSLASIRAAFDAAESALGPVQVLVNNAGIAHQAKALDVQEADFDRVFDANAKGAFFTARECASRMIRGGIQGRIINMASVAGLVTMPQLAVYGMSKAAIIHMTKSLAREWARHGINVNAICPGYVATELNAGFFETDPGKALIAKLPKRRLGEPGDLEGVLLLLASDQPSRFITGAAITVDDGYGVG